MISEEVEKRITWWYFTHYLPQSIIKELESHLLPYFLEEEQPNTGEMVLFAIEFIQRKLNEAEE